MISFSLYAPSGTVAGPGTLDRVGDLIAPADSSRILLVTDAGVAAAGLDRAVLDHLEGRGRAIVSVTDTPREPSVRDVEAVLAVGRDFRPTLVVGLGGGSVLDTAKLLGVLSTGGQSLSELVRGETVGPRTVDTLLIPTTAGTGSEATKNAILSVPEENRKVGIVSPSFVPSFVILDGDLTVSMPPAVTATTGMDALAHALECYLSTRANALSDLLALEAARLIAANLCPAFDNPNDRTARQAMLTAAFYAGLCITLSGTTAVHALSYPLGAVFHVPHGQANAMLLPQVMEFNLPVLPEKAQRLAEAMGAGDRTGEEDSAAGLVRVLEGLLEHLQIPRSMSTFGVAEADIPRLAEAAHGIRRLMDNNPREMTTDVMKSIYERIL